MTRHGHASSRSIRYPVKGLSPEPLARTRLAAGQTLPADRLYAIENGPSGFDPAAPAYFPKPRFLMLMRNERLAALRTRFDEASHTLTDRGRRPGGGARRPADARGPGRDRAVLRRAICADELRGPPKVLARAGPQLLGRGEEGGLDHQSRLGRRGRDRRRRAVHPLRFRGNLYVAGWPAWHEFDLLGREIAIGPDARLKVVKRIVRCAATNVDPDTGIRDLAIPHTLMQTFGHADCGVYAEVVADGPIEVGDELRA